MSVGTLLQRTAVLLLVVVLAVAALVLLQSGGSSHKGAASRHSTSGAKTPGGRAAFINQSQLPVEARQTIRRIDAGGPFPYERDGFVFANREGLLPNEPSGYYHEYTVATPGSGDRGARRIVQGSGGRLYWSDDHYKSFRQIRRN